jgi:2-(1,2-epoxy-1,2-dihydrophenyl)acetyl-CoA isomerase
MPDMTYEAITYEVRDEIATVTLNRPAQRNALDIQMREELADAVMVMRNDPSLKAAVLTGAGGAFCAGGDIKGMAEARKSVATARRRIQNLHVWLPELINLELPVIAAVDGAAFGAGLILALAADFVLATPRARFCAVFGRIGLVPDASGFFLLPRIVGLQAAKDLVFTARSFDAREAKELGIVYQIHDSEGFLDTALNFAGRFRYASREAIGMSKNILNNAFHMDQKALGELESFAQGVAMHSDYHKEATKRFVEKKPLLFDWDQLSKEVGGDD